MGNHLIIWIFTKKWEPLIRSNERMKKIWTQISWRIVWSPRYPKHWSRNKVLWENGLESWSHLWLKIKFLQLFHRDWWIFQYSNSIFEKKLKRSANSVHRSPGADKCPQDAGSVCPRYCACGEREMDKQSTISIRNWRCANFLNNSNDNHWDVMNIGF